MIRRTKHSLLVVMMLTPSMASQVDAIAADAALDRGVSWLLEQQAEDGGWYSSTYGTLRSGTGVTALALHALTTLGPVSQKACHEQIERGIDFLISRLEDGGYTFGPDQSADYPTYATAMLLESVSRFAPQRWQAEKRMMRNHLLAIQRRGATHDVLRGGWPQDGGASEESNVNISVSRFVASSLVSDLKSNRRARDSLLEFVENCRNPDGGYYFLPVTDNPLNKAGHASDGGVRPYGTATADAVLTLYACGLDGDNGHVQGALKWLERHRSLVVVPGLTNSASPSIGADSALKFYYWVALARVIHTFPDAEIADCRDDLRVVIEHRQRTDGSWANTSSLFYEDDPLIATALSVEALSYLK